MLYRAECEGGLRRRVGLSGILTLVVTSLLGCFTEDQVRGLPCTNDAHCGDLLKCESGVCGGPTRDFGENPCESGFNECADENTISQCVGGVPQNTSCAASCAAQGFTEALGCAVPPSTGVAQCFCREESATCSFPSVGPQCSIYSRNLVECVGADWQYTDCDQYCRTQGATSQGCTYVDSFGSCSCVPMACNPDQSQRYCVDQDTVAICDGSQWIEAPCSDALCPGGVSLGCGYSSVEDDFTCICAY